MKCSFFGKFCVLCFLETPVLRFALLPYYRRSKLFHFREEPVHSGGFGTPKDIEEIPADAVEKQETE